MEKYKEEYRVNGVRNVQARSVSGELTLGGVFGISIVSKEDSVWGMNS